MEVPLEIIGLSKVYGYKEAVKDTFKNVPRIYFGVKNSPYLVN